MSAPPAGAGYWQRHARRYDRVTLLLNARLPALAAEIAAEVAGLDPVVEVAAGTGLVSVALAATAGSLVATDRSEEMLDVLRARLGATGRRADVRIADALALPFADASVAAVVAANLLHLLPDPGAALDEIRRVLRPGGLLAVPTFAHGETAVARTVSRALALTGFPIVTRYRGDSLALLVATRGFDVVMDRTVPGVLPIRDVRARRPQST